MALFPALVLPSMIFAGYLVNQKNIPFYFYEIEYISPFRYIFMASAIVIILDFSFVKKNKFIRITTRITNQIVVILNVIHWQT